MSQINEIEMTNPYGETDNVLQVTIDSSSDVYLLHKAIKSTGDYTFSIWHKSNSNSQIIFNLFGISLETIESTTEWQKYVKTVSIESLDNTDIYMQPSVNIDSYFYEGYLSEGIADTSWTPAPEDLYEEIGTIHSKIEQTADRIRLEVNDEIAGKSASITTNCESIILAAGENYAKTGDLDSFKNEVSTQLSVLEGEIQMKFEAASDQTNDVSDTLNQTNSDLAKYFDFSLDGLVIKAGEGEMQLHLDNDIVRFMKNGEQFGWWDGVNFHTGNLYVDVYERAQFGNFAYVPRSDGSLSFLKVDDYVMIKIIKQPISLTKAIGTTATFSVEATGSDLTYQWEVKSKVTISVGNGTTTITTDWASTTHSTSNSISYDITSDSFTKGDIRWLRCKITDRKNKSLYTDTVTLQIT